MPLTCPDVRGMSERSLAAVADVYESSFPAEERVPFPDVVRGLLDGRRRLWLKGAATGFAITAPLATSSADVLLEYLAVEQGSRSRGIGRSMIEGLLEQLAGPIVLEVDDPSASTDPYAGRRINFYERNGAREIPFSRGYGMPRLNGGGLLPMRLFDLDPSRRRQPWRREQVRDLVGHIWVDGYGIDAVDDRLSVILEMI